MSKQLSLSVAPRSALLILFGLALCSGCWGRTARDRDGARGSGADPSADQDATAAGGGRSGGAPSISPPDAMGPPMEVLEEVNWVLLDQRQLAPEARIAATSAGGLVAAWLDTSPISAVTHAYSIRRSPSGTWSTVHDHGAALDVAVAREKSTGSVVAWARAPASPPDADAGDPGDYEIVYQRATADDDWSSERVVVHHGVARGTPRLSVVAPPGGGDPIVAWADAEALWLAEPQLPHAYDLEFDPNAQGFGESGWSGLVPFGQGAIQARRPRDDGKRAIAFDAPNMAAPYEELDLMHRGLQLVAAEDGSRAVFFGMHGIEGEDKRPRATAFDLASGAPFPHELPGLPLPGGAATENDRAVAAWISNSDCGALTVLHSDQPTLWGSTRAFATARGDVRVAIASDGSTAILVSALDDCTSGLPGLFIEPPEGRPIAVVRRWSSPASPSYVRFLNDGSVLLALNTDAGTLIEIIQAASD